MMQTRLRWSLFALVLVGLALAFPEQAHATTAGGSGLPWETPVQRFVDSLLGPIAIAMVLLGFVGGVWRFMIGGQIDNFISSMLMLILCGSILLAAKPLISQFYGVSTLLP